MGISEALQTQLRGSGYPFERILVPLDGSASAERTLATVQALCGRSASQIVLLRVVEPPPPGAAGPAAQDLVRIAELYLRRASGALHLPEIQPKIAVRVGPASETVLAVAAENDISLIAMSTHGRLTSTALPFGTVADHLLRSSTVPILAIPAHASAAKSENASRTLLVPFQGNPSDRNIVPIAVDFAVAIGADLAVLLWIAPPAWTGRGEAEVLVDGEQRLRKLAGPFESKRIPTVQLVKRGDPVAAILEAARSSEADVLAIGTGSDAGGDSILRTVLATSTIPVLLSPAS